MRGLLATGYEGEDGILPRVTLINEVKKRILGLYCYFLGRGKTPKEVFSNMIDDAKREIFSAAELCDEYSSRINDELYLLSTGMIQ